MQESMHGEIEQVSSSGDAQRCESSTGQIAMTEDSVIQVFLEMLDNEYLSTVVQDTSLCRQESEKVGSEDAQLCVSLVDSQEIQEADFLGQSVSMTDYDCIGADFLVMQSFLDMLDSEHEDFVV